MKVDVVVPRFAEENAKATILFWFKEVGEQVQEGDELLEITTEKATMDIEAPASGKLSVVLFKAGEEVFQAQKVGEIETGVELCGTQNADQSGRSLA